MELGLAYFAGKDPLKISIAKQMGVEHVVTSVRHVDKRVEDVYDYRNLLAMKKGFEDEGLKVSVIEGIGGLNDAKLGLPGKDAAIERFFVLLKNLDRLNIRTVCYNWMPIIEWFRSSNALKTRGGALVTGFDLRDVENAPETEYGAFSEETMWANLEYFLKAAVPVAEQHGIRLALHPDDPPVSPLFGISRILTSADNLQRALDIYPNEYNGLTFCQGCVSTMGEDVVAAIHRFGGQKKIFFVHFRDIHGTKERFQEAFHDDGITDMVAAMKAYYDVGFDGIARPDHVPTMAGEDKASPSYGLMGNLFAVGYIRGLMESVEKSR